jgi:hypothetical protein
MLNRDEDAPPGNPENLTKEQAAILYQLKEYIRENNIGSPLWDDWMLLRFCRARKFNYKKALKMFLAYIEFRREHAVDDILSRDMFHVTKTYSTMGGGWWTVAKNGMGVCFMRTHGLKAKIYNSVSLEDHIRNEIYQNEILTHAVFPYLSKQAGKRIDKTIYILDMQGCAVMENFDSTMRNINNKLMAIRQDFYPEMLHKYIIINAGWGLNMVYAMVKWCLDEKTRDKFKIFGSGYKKTL